jgi:hypothetical protein
MVKIDYMNSAHSQIKTIVLERREYFNTSTSLYLIILSLKEIGQTSLWSKTLR